MTKFKKNINIVTIYKILHPSLSLPKNYKYFYTLKKFKKFKKKDSPFSKIKTFYSTNEIENQDKYFLVIKLLSSFHRNLNFLKKHTSNLSNAIYTPYKDYYLKLSTFYKFNFKKKFNFRFTKNKNTKYAFKLTKKNFKTKKTKKIIFNYYKNILNCMFSSYNYSSKILIKNNSIFNFNKLNSGFRYNKVFLYRYRQYYFKNHFFKKIQNIIYSKSIKDFRTINSPVLEPSTNVSFFLNNFSLFLMYKYITFRKFFFNVKYRFRYKHFSFIKKNEYQKSIFQYKRKLNLVKNLSHIIKESWNFNKTSFNSNVYGKLQKFNSYFNFYSNFYDNFPTNIFNIFSLNNTFKTSLKADLDFSIDYPVHSFPSDLKMKEFFTPRLKFRRGYQKVWRTVRSDFKDYFSLNFRYQCMLTRYITRFHQKSKNILISKDEMILDKLIIFSHLLPDLSTVHEFINKNLVFLNSFVVKNPKLDVFKNDLIQVKVSIWYYIYYRWLSNWALTKHRKFKYLVYRKGLAYQYKVSKTKKTKSYYVPNWIEKFLYDFSDIKPHLEIDYFTLSFFIIYDPYINFFYKTGHINKDKGNIFRLYNWKYIT